MHAQNTSHRNRRSHLLRQSPTPISHFKAFMMNGCLSASAGVILFSGLSAKQRSSRSLNSSSSLISASLRPFDADMRRVRRSRDGLLNARVLMVSYNRYHVSEIFILSSAVWWVPTCGVRGIGVGEVEKWQLCHLRHRRHSASLFEQITTWGRK